MWSRNRDMETLIDRKINPSESSGIEVYSLVVIAEALQQPQELDFKGDFLHDEKTSVSVNVIYSTKRFF